MTEVIIMETIVRKIGNSVGTIFPKDISPKVEDVAIFLFSCFQPHEMNHG